MERLKKLLKIIFGIPLTLISFFFIGKIFIDSWPQIQNQLEGANFILLIIGIFFMLGFFLVRSFAWIKILNFFAEHDKSVTESIYHFALAETKRYIPGNIFSFISRIQKFESASYSKKTILHGIVLESLIVIIAAFVISLPAIVNFLNNQETYISILLFAIALLGALLIIYFSLRKQISKYLKDKLSKAFPKKDIFSYINVISISSLSWALFGIANFFLASAIFPTDPNNIIIFSSIFVLSWLLGYLAFVVPMGLGIREAATIYLLNPFIPLFAATAISVFTRIFFVVSEVVFLLIAWFMHRLPKNIKQKNKPGGIHIVAFFGFIYAAYFTFFTIIRHLNFMTGRYDLGNMEQTVWNTINGNIFVLSNYEGTGSFLRLAIHADFILILLAPIYAVFQNPITLLVIQTLVIGTGGFFVYLLAKKIIKREKLAVILAAGYYLNFFVHEQNIFDFHSVSLTTAFLLGAFYFLYEKRYRLFSVMLLLAVLTKENVYLVSAIFGGYLYFLGKKTAGSILFLVSVTVFFFLMLVAIPWAKEGEHFALGYLSYLGNSPIEILLSPILNPVTFFGQLFSIDTFNYIYKIFLPVGFLSFLSPLYLIFALPDFLINVMADNPNLRSIQYHYGALLVPFVYISAIFAIKKIISRINNKDLAVNIIFYYLLFFIFLSVYLFSPLPGTKNADTAPFKYNEDKSEIYESLDYIPDNASVSATNNIAAHLSQRKHIYVVPNGIEEVEYLVFYRDEMDIGREISLYNDDFAIVVDTRDLIILKRVNSRDKAYTP